MSPTRSGSYDSDAVAERRAQKALNEKVGDRLPERRGHDMEALTAYAMYTQGREWRTTPARLSIVPPERVELESEEAGTRRLLAAIGTDGGNRGGTHGSTEI